MSQPYFYFKVPLLGLSVLAILLSGRAVAFELPQKQDSFESIELPLLQARASKNIYRVKLGDTLWGISLRHGLNLNQVLELNPELRANPNLILVGQKINLGGAREVQVVSRRSSPPNTWQPQKVLIPRPISQSTAPGPTPPPITQPPASRPSAWTFNLPNQIRPGSSRFAARRGSPACYVDKKDVAKTLMPENNFGYTLRDYPSFFWYQPELSVKSVPVTFRLSEARSDNPKKFDKIYETKFTSSGSGIINFTLPPDASPLKEEQKYVWQVLIKCESGGSTLLKGYIQRLSTDNPQLQTELANAAIEDYPKILAKAGIWYDILPIMSALLQKDPDNAGLVNSWSEIFAAIGYKDLSQLLSP